MVIHKSPSARQIQPIGFRGRLEATKAPTMGKARKSTKVTASPMMPTMVELSGNRADPARKSSTPTATNMATQRPANDHASKEAARVLIPPLIRSWPFVPSVTTPLYSTTLSQALRQTLRGSLSERRGPNPRRFTYQGMKRCMLVSVKRARIFRRSVRCWSSPHISSDPPPTSQYANRLTRIHGTARVNGVGSMSPSRSFDEAMRLPHKLVYVVIVAVVQAVDVC